MPSHAPISGQTASGGGGGGGGTIQTSYVLEAGIYIPTTFPNGSIGLALAYDPKKEYVFAVSSTPFGGPAGVITLSEVYPGQGGSAGGPTYSLSPQLWFADTLNAVDIFADESVMTIPAGMVNGLSAGFAGGISNPIPGGGTLDLLLKPPVRIDATYARSGVLAQYFILASRIVTE